MGYLFSVTRQVFQLVEKDTQTKLDLLFRRNLYTIAISLAHHQQVAPLSAL